MSESSIEDFLANASRLYDEELTNELVYEAVKRRFDEAIERNKVPTAFRFDDELSQTLSLIVDSDVRKRLADDRAQFMRAFVYVLYHERFPRERDRSVDKR